MLSNLHIGEFICNLHRIIADGIDQQISEVFIAGVGHNQVSEVFSG